MKSLVLVLFMAGGLGTALAQSSPFVDIPPCHWATEAVTRIAGEPEVDPATARNSTYLAENSLRQVFEGLRCEDPAWSLAFLQDAPTSFADGSAMLSGFDLQTTGTQLTGDTGRIVFTVQATLAAPNGPTTLARQGEAALQFVDGRWLVDYTSLAALELPVFPR